jgi:hypothetical protein
MTTLEYIFDVLSWGSSVSFYFARHLQVEADNEGSRQVMFDVVTMYGEIVLGYPSPESPELAMAIISGPSELTELLMFHPEGALVVWGQWPPRENDGKDAITVNLVDNDGILRPHPH